MKLGYPTFKEAIAKAAHYKALGQTSIYLDESDPDVPWDKIERIEASGSYRLNGPCGFRCIASVDGLTFNWSIDFEKRDANGRGYSMFDRDRLRSIIMKLQPGARYLLTSFMEKEVLPGLEKTTAKWRDSFNKQLDSEDCVRGLIAFAAAH